MRRPSSHGSRHKGPSQRQLRVGEQMRHVIAELLQRGELHDPALDRVSLVVSEVRVSPDLRHATVFMAELGHGLRTSTADHLQRHAAQLGGRLAKELHLKYAPKVKFLADESFAEAAHIEALIDQERAALSEKHADDPANGAKDG